MSRFPLTESAGLTVSVIADFYGPHKIDQCLYYILASDVEALLAANCWRSDATGNPNTDKPTHEGFLLNWKPIVRDTAEGLLREYLRRWTQDREGVVDGMTHTELKERAHKLLGEK